MNELLAVSGKVAKSLLAEFTMLPFGVVTLNLESEWANQQPETTTTLNVVSALIMINIMEEHQIQLEINRADISSGTSMFFIPRHSALNADHWQSTYICTFH